MSARPPGSPPIGEVARTRRAPWRPIASRTTYRGAVTTLDRLGRVVAVALLGGFVLAGCAAAPTASTSTSGAATGTAPAPRTTAPSAPPSIAAPSTTAPPAARAPVTDGVALPWPVSGGAETAALQAEVDRGAQPWLLDPSEVAISYAAAALGWTDAEAYPGPDGTSVDIRNAEGERRTLTLTQPGRTGDDGIWVVTAEH